MVIEIPSMFFYILFLVLVILFIFYGSIFTYHWNHYGLNKTTKKVARVSYFFVSAILLFAVAFFIGLYNF